MISAYVGAPASCRNGCDLWFIAMFQRSGIPTRWSGGVVEWRSPEPWGQPPLCHQVKVANLDTFPKVGALEKHPGLEGETKIHVLLPTAGACPFWMLLSIGCEPTRVLSVLFIHSHSLVPLWNQRWLRQIRVRLWNPPVSARFLNGFYGSGIKWWLDQTHVW